MKGSLYKYIISILLFCSCSRIYREIYIQFNRNCSGKIAITVINSDTSYLTSHQKNPFPVKVNKLWIINYSKDTGKYFRYKAIRDFSSLDTLKNIFCFNNSDWENLKHTINFYKKFRWFYTIYEYNEEFQKVNPFKVPVSKYLSTKELKIWEEEDDEFKLIKDTVKKNKIKNAIDEKINLWLSECYIEEFLKVTDSIISSDTTFNKSIQILKLKDTIVKKINIKSDIDFKTIVKFIANFYNNRRIEQVLLPQTDTILNKIDKNNNLLDYFSENYKFKILMPGKLFESNSNKIVKDTLVWEVTAYKFFFENYKLKAKSRTRNDWTVYLSVFIILLIPGYYYIKRRKIKIRFN
jgi:hypothetical protein